MSRVGISLVGTASLALALALAPRGAEACGGTFCDSLPQDPMPVDQRGEDILFVVDDGMVEVHIRIQYEGEAERFAWVVPLQGIPEVEVGSDAVFRWLYQRINPQWTRYRTFDCQEDDPSWGGDGDGDTGDGDGDGDGDGGPMVVLQETVGAFEVVVLQGGTAAEVIDFLDANDYAQDPDAEPILQDYLDQGFLFAAIKLTASADVDEIHPLAFRFPGDEPCVPIRLTAIAAKENMDIRAYILGDEYWAPSNYAHVVPNPLAFNWAYPMTNGYSKLLEAAVDEAGGRGFVTEYRGDSGSTPFAVWSALWNSNAFIGLDPIQALDVIGDQGLQVHPLIQSLLMEFIPPPENVDPLDFWNFPDFYADQFDLDAWGDGSGFAAAVEERIIQPGLHARGLFESYPNLTALHTRMSPFEMTVDPIFHTAPDLPEIGDLHQQVEEQVLCGGQDSIFHIPVDGEDWPVCVPDGGFYPTWEMPAALRIEQIPMVGPPQVTTDNTQLITQIYDAYRQNITCTPSSGDGDGDPGDGDGDSGDGDSGDGDPGDGDSGDGDGGPDSGGTSGADGTSGPAMDESSTSCACSTSNGAPLGLGMALLGLGLLVPRRRRD
jgi:MYXO-CTERM domain-containing protein